MESQSNFLLNDPFLGQGSSEKNLSGNTPFPTNQAQLGGYGMNRHLSSQSNLTTASGTSVSTDFTEFSAASTNSFSTQNWDHMTDLDSVPPFKFEHNMYDFTMSMDYSAEDQFGDGRGPSPMTEQANKFEHMSIDYQQQPGHNSPGLYQGSSQSIPREYIHSFDGPSLSPDKGHSYSMGTQRPPSMARTSSNRSNLGVYPHPVPYLASNSPSSYTNSQSDEEYTPRSLGWPANTNYVEKYNLIINPNNKNKHYLQIINEDDVTWTTPRRVYLESALSPQKGAVYCPWPGPCSREEPFGRAADCERHLTHVHGPRDLRPEFLCSYKPCLNGRHSKENAFTRKDHLRDHYRDFHLEDLGSAKGEKSARGKDEKRAWQKEQKKWLASRHISAAHWRCVKCLVKMSVAKHGWQCLECKQTCEAERIERRLNLSPREDVQDDSDGMGGMGGMGRQEAQPLQYQQSAPCATCFGSQWVDNGNGEWDACPSCNYHQKQIGARAFR